MNMEYLHFPSSFPDTVIVRQRMIWGDILMICVSNSVLCDCVFVLLSTGDVTKVATACKINVAEPRRWVQKKMR